MVTPESAPRPIESAEYHLSLNAPTQPVRFHWQQVDQRLSGILQSKVSAEIRELITDDVGHIRFQNMHNGNSMTVPSQRLRMQNLRTAEWAARLYEGYCEIWQTQRMPISAEFLRGIVKNAISVLRSARANSVTYELVEEQHRTGSDANWLQPALEAFKRDLQMLEHNWNQRAEFDAMTVQYMLLEAPENTATKIAARKVITARARIRTLEAMIAGIEERIAMAEQALNGMLMANTPPYRKSSVKQSLSRLKTERTELRSSLNQWQHRMQAALVSAENAQADDAASVPARSTSPNTREATEKGTEVRARRGSRRINAQRTARKRQRANAVLLPPYRSEWKRATKALLIKDSKMPGLEICRRLDDDAIGLPRKWTVGKNRSFEDAYRDAILRQRIHTAISKMRAELRKAGVIG
jgi:hypothetical protein